MLHAVVAVLANHGAVTAIHSLLLLVNCGNCCGVVVSKYCSARPKFRLRGKALSTGRL